MSNARLLLVLDTATRQPVLGLARADARASAPDLLVAERTWESRHRHGEQLLEQLDALLDEAGARPADLAAIVAGTGPGSFTGLRIGLATAKTLAYSLEVPIVGVPTTLGLALAAAAGTPGQQTIAITLPAGATDRYVAVVRVGGTEPHELSTASLVAGTDAITDATAGSLLVAVDLQPPDVSREAAERGRAAVAVLCRSLAVIGVSRLAGGEHDDVAALVPAYVALPRGVTRSAEEIRWSPDLR